MAKKKTSKGKAARQPALETTLTQTYQARLELTPAAASFLDAGSAFWAHLEHQLFADLQRLGIDVPKKAEKKAAKDQAARVAKGKKPATPGTDGRPAKPKQAPSQKPIDVLKRRYLAEEGLTSRQFNAIHRRITGMISSILERRPALIEEKQAQIAALEKTLTDIEQRLATSTRRSVIKNGRNALFGKKRRLDILRYQLKKLEADEAARRVRLCFGSRKLFLAQYQLQESGFKTHAEWKTAWQAARSSEMYFIGSMDETAGNQTCQARVTGDHQLALRIRVPDGLQKKHGKFVELEDIRVAYGFEAIVAALDECQLRARLKAQKNDAYQTHGQAISFRFKKDAKGWRVFITTGLARPAIVTDRRQGVIGVDLNADHLAVVETDRFGNPVNKWSLPWNCYGLNQRQAEALTSAVVGQLVELAGRIGKSLVIERLDFQAKKQTLAGESRRYARMLSSFAYHRFYTMLTARAYRLGVEVWTVNPAYTSLIGRVKFMDRFGLTVHQAAALVIGRRFLRCSEQPPRCWRPVPDGRKGHVTLDAPARMRKPDGRPSGHVWVFWAAVSRHLKAAHEARRRDDHGLAWLDRLRRRLQSGACGQGKKRASGQRTRNRRSDSSGVTCA